MIARKWQEVKKERTAKTASNATYQRLSFAFESVLQRVFQLVCNALAVCICVRIVIVSKHEQTRLFEHVCVSWTQMQLGRRVKLMRRL